VRLKAFLLKALEKRFKNPKIHEGSWRKEAGTEALHWSRECANQAFLKRGKSGEVGLFSLKSTSEVLSGQGGELEGIHFWGLPNPRRRAK